MERLGAIVNNQMRTLMELQFRKARRGPWIMRLRMIGSERHRNLSYVVSSATKIMGILAHFDYRVGVITHVAALCHCRLCGKYT